MTEGVAIASEAAVRKRRRQLRLPALAGLVTLGVLLCALRGIHSINLWSDAPNHLANGAMIFDWLRSGRLAHPIDFATRYYTHLPIITIPYHPPFFPAMEAFFFAIFGVSIVAARVLVALCSAVAALLLYRLLRVYGNSTWLSAGVTATFFSLGITQNVATNVMLEMPALMYLLGALLQLAGIHKGEFGWRRAAAYGVLAGVALWTKQNAIFLGVLPFVYIALSRRWELLRRWPLWFSIGIFGVMAAALQRFMFAHGGKATKYVPLKKELSSMMLHNVKFYVDAVVIHLSWPVAAGVTAAGLLFLFVRRWRPNPIIEVALAWIISCFAVLFYIGMYDVRYLFFVYAPILIVAFVALDRAAGAMWPQRGRYVIAGLALVISVVNIQKHPFLYLTGPAEAANFVVNGQRQRILYCGPWVGNFAAQTRVLDPALQTVILRSDRLMSTFSRQEIEEKANKYGVQWIVMVNNHWRPNPQIQELFLEPSPSMVLEHEIPIRTSVAAWKGDIRIFRFSNPSPTPANPELRIPKLNTKLDSGAQ